MNSGNVKVRTYLLDKDHNENSNLVFDSFMYDQELVVANMKGLIFVNDK